MTRADIIKKSRNLLNEVLPGFWGEDELYGLAFIIELDLIRLLNDRYTKDYRKAVDLSTKILCPYFSDACLFELPVGFVREVKVYTKDTDAVNELDEATYVEFDNLSTYKEISYMMPTQKEPIYWLDNNIDGLNIQNCIGVAPQPTAKFTWHLLYLNIPDVWSDSNKAAAPLLHPEAHEIIAFGVAKLALIDDGEFTAASGFEKLYTEAVQRLGIRMALKRETQP